MESLILVLHIVVCVLLVVLVLLQSGKEGMGVIFGGGNTSVFGSTGAGSMLAKMTAFVAFIFVCTSLAYTYVTSDHVTDESAVLNVRIEEPAAPAAPAQPAEPAKDGAVTIPTAPVPSSAASSHAAPAAEAPAASEAAAPEAKATGDAPAETAPATEAPAASARPEAAPAGK